MRSLFATALRRVTLATLALLGEFEGLSVVSAEVERLRATEASLRRILYRMHAERTYWYDLWMSMGRDWEGTQEVLLREIDTLRRELGKPEQSRYNELLKRKFQDRYSRPQHPSLAVSTTLKAGEIQVPPVRPSEAVVPATQDAPSAPMRVDASGAVVPAKPEGQS